MNCCPMNVFLSCVVTTSLEVIVIMLAEPLGEYRPASALMVTVMFDYTEVAARQSDDRFVFCSQPHQASAGAG